MISKSPLAEALKETNDKKFAYACGLILYVFSPGDCIISMTIVYGLYLGN